MKQRLFLILITLSSSTLAAINDPVADYKARQGLESTDIIYRWTADVDGSGKNEVFLSLKEEYLDSEKAIEVPTWVVYMPKRDGTGYALSSGEDDNGVMGVAPIADITHSTCILDKYPNSISTELLRLKQTAPASPRL